MFKTLDFHPPIATPECYHFKFIYVGAKWHLDLGDQNFVLWYSALMHKVGQILFKIWLPPEPISCPEAVG